MKVAVLGGGLQGACAALELAGHGVDVDLYEKHDRCVSQASAQNEGKLHLGYVYANDPSLATARAMIRGALAFAPAMRRWIGSSIDRVPVSDPFHYVVHFDSLLGVDDVEAHLRKCHAIAIEESRESSPDYFGSDFRQAPERLSEAELASLFDRRKVRAAFRTAEIGIDPEALAEAVRAQVESHPRIRCLLRTKVASVERNLRDVVVQSETATGEQASERYDQAVNSLWEGRLAVDRTAGIEPDRPWLFRLKHFLRVPPQGEAPSFPSTTIVLGPFGDAVRYANSASYLSWYPAGLRGMSSEIAPPDWPTSLEGADAGAMRRAIYYGLVEIVPGLREFSRESLDRAHVRGGIIFAWGQTDIVDAASGLHERHAIGPRSSGRYHTVDTGKLTTAPLFARQVADRVLSGRIETPDTTPVRARAL